MQKDILMKDFLKRTHQKKLRINCVGDSVVDEYYDVQVNRISPEHPVPVMVCQNNLVRKPGGAANVAYQLKHLNVETKLACFNDKEAIELFKKHGINCITHYSSKYNCSLPIKRRYVENGIQVAPRHDIEQKNCNLSLESIHDFSMDLCETISSDNPDVTIFSDYDKGFFLDESGTLFKNQRGITIVDPKNGPLSKWHGCTIFKPNSKEALELSGKTKWQDQAKFLQSELECEAVVITFGGKMVAGIWQNELFCYEPTESVKVESVIGAGDCFAAFFAVAIGHGFNPIEASEIAWKAGSVYVQQRMNRPVVLGELISDKIVRPEDLSNRDFKLVFTNGCFDIMHRGHIESLKFCKSKGDKLVVAINSDESVRREKGPSRPVVSQENRMAIMAAIGCVDFVVLFEEDTPLETIKIIRPDVLAKGGDYKIENIIGADIVSEVYQAPMVLGVSTSIMLENHFLHKQS